MQIQLDFINGIKNFPDVIFLIIIIFMEYKILKKIEDVRHKALIYWNTNFIYLIVKKYLKFY